MSLQSFSDEELIEYAAKCQQRQLDDGPRYIGILLVFGIVAGLGGLACMFDMPSTPGWVRMATLAGLVALWGSWKLDKDRQRRKAYAAEYYREAEQEFERRRTARPRS